MTVPSAVALGAHTGVLYGTLSGDGNSSPREPARTKELWRRCLMCSLWRPLQNPGDFRKMKFAGCLSQYSAESYTQMSLRWTKSQSKKGRVHNRGDEISSVIDVLFEDDSDIFCYESS